MSLPDSPVVHNFTISPMFYSFPSTRLYVDTPMMSSSDPMVYLPDKYDCYAYVGGQKYEVKECIQVGISFLDDAQLSSIIHEQFVLPMCNLKLPDSSQIDFWTNDEINNSKNIDCYKFNYDNEVFTIAGIEQITVQITPSTNNQCYQISLSFNYTEVLDYINNTYSTSYTSGDQITCYVLSVSNYFNGNLLSAGSKTSELI